MEAPDETTKAFRTRTHGAVKFFARGAREATGTSSSSQGAEESAAAAAVVLDATAKAEAVGAARASGKLGAEVAPPSAPPTDTFWTPQPPDAGATRTALAAQGGVEPPWAHRLFIAVCDGGSATRRKGRGCEDLRARAEATEARDASNNGAS